MQISDVIGFTLEDARVILINRGISVGSVKVSSPPKFKSEIYDDNYRVVNVKATDENIVELTVCKPL